MAVNASKSVRVPSVSNPVRVPSASLVPTHGFKGLQSTQKNGKKKLILAGPRPVQTKPTLDDGNCFFSAIFRALQEREGLLQIVATCLTLDASDEMAFIESFRNKIADRIALGNIPFHHEKNGIIDSYDYLVGLTANSNTYSKVIAHYPSWFKKEFGEKGEKLGIRSSFCERLALHIRTMGEWVGEIEVYIVKEELLQCNIILRIHNHIETHLLKNENGKAAIHLHNQGEQHYEYFSFFPEEKKAEEKGASESEEKGASAEEKSNPCPQLYDPCTKEPIGSLAELEKRIRDLKQQSIKDIQSQRPLQSSMTRLDLLLNVLNRAKKPNEGLLDYKLNGQVYEAYWDIVFALGLIDEFPIKDDFYMYNGKIETLVHIDEPHFINTPLTYLQSRKVNEGSKSGASDITFVYKQNKINLDADPCSSDPTIKVTDSCKEVEGKQSEQTDKPLFYFCSSKYFKHDNQKGVDKFDIQNIYTAAKKLHEEYDRKIILLVKDKNAVEEKMRRAIRKYISEEATYIYGMDDLFNALSRLYDFVKPKYPSKITKEILSEILHLESKPLPIMRLRLHQYIATYKICDAIKEFRETRSTDNKFLVGIVPRGGKTYIAGGIIDKLLPKRVVVLLGAKSETLSQFKADLFEQFQNFREYECIDVVDKVVKDERIDPEKKYIFMMSVELYKTESSTRPILQELKGGKLRADLFICDEAHLKQTTHKAAKQMARGTSVQEQKEDKVDEKKADEDEISEEEEQKELKEIDEQIQNDIPVVYMTGTYMKPLSIFNIQPDHTIIWDYQDIQEAKKLTTNEEYFKQNFGEYYDRALDTCTRYGQTHEIIEQEYKKFPELYLLTTQFTPSAKDAFLKEEGKGYPTLTHLFKVRRDFNPERIGPERWYTGFTIPKGIMRLLNYLAPKSQQVMSIQVPNMDEEKIDPIDSALTSVDHIAQRIGDRLRFFTSDFVVHSQLWFLPHMNGHPLGKRMCALAGAIFQIPWFRKYFHVIAVSSSVDWKKLIPRSQNNSVKIPALDGSDSCGIFSWACPTTEKSLKQCLIDEEIKARKKGKGLIILAQNMLHLGISLPCVDIIVLLDNGEKVDERIQKMYRALTESINKKGGYIIDLNYFRTVTAIMNYQMIGKESRTGKRVYPRAQEVPSLFNKVLDIFSIDDDKPIFGTHEERANGKSQIQKETIPELQRLLQRPSKDGHQLDNVGDALNKNIDEVLAKTYLGSYAEFLGSLKEEANKKVIRKANRNVPEAESNSESESESKSESKSYPNPVIFPFPDITSEETKRKAYIEMFKTTLKFGAFGTNASDLEQLESKLGKDESLREVLYDTLIKRGIIAKDTLRTDEQRNFVIDIIILPKLTNLRKIKDANRGNSYMALKTYVNDNAHYPESVQKVLEYIAEHLAPKTAERHKFGEVFTPMTLVHEMLDTLPDTVWKDKDLKWLDPANGMGNYPIATFLRLFYGFRTNDGKYIGITEIGDGKYNPGLTRVIKNETARRKHIVEKMLFMVELNSKNNAIARRLFMKLAPGVEPNIIQMHRINGFLADIPMKFHNGTVNEFDIVIGNPPFNKGTILRKQTQKVKAEITALGLEDTARESLWTKFIIKIFTKNIVKNNGYLLFITPINWFHPETTGTRDIILSRQIHHIRIIFLEQSKKLFGGSGELTTAYYLIQNTPPTKSTRIIDMLQNDEQLMLTQDSIIILAFNSIYSKVYKKSDLFLKTNAIKSTTVKGCVTGLYKQIIGIYENGEIQYVKTNIKHPLADQPKLIINGYTYPRYYYDRDGDYGKYPRDGTNFIIIGDDLDKVQQYFDTKLSALLLNYIKFTQKKIDPKYYPDIRSIPLKKITDETLADYFGFTKEERASINATEYPKRQYKFKEITCAQIKGNKDPKEGGSRFRKTRKNYSKAGGM